MSAPELTPGERLTLSRERLRQALAQDASHPDTSLTGLLTGGSGLKDVLKALVPGSAEAVDALAACWEQVNLRQLAQQRPVALVGGAVVAGLLLAWTRPWRWLIRPSMFSTIGPALMTTLLTSGVVQSWIRDVLSTNSQAKTATEDASTAPHGTAPSAPQPD